ncbi:MAG: nucleotidyl transferase AbiEii/AbiGii toxin family protein [Phycisphaerae bacterium]|nr:nucleotidyl transferase AbiEii/AbiGii toxin family protein [Phycisphaerae bacterium]
MKNTDIAKSIHQRLLNVRDKTGEDFNSILTRYGLERILYRIMLSGQSETFILKGAMLFRLWHEVSGRPTRDIDFLGFGELSRQRIREIFTDVCNVSFIEDGLSFDSDSIRVDDIRDDQEYFGVRIRLHGFLNNARIPIQIDVGFGDAVIPVPEVIEYPTILDLPVPRLRAYHPATVIAEKVNAMVVHGFMNSRMKDFYDVYILLNHIGLDDDLLAKAIKATFQRRKIALPKELPIAFTADFLEDGTKQTQWKAFLNRSDLSDFDFTLAQILDDLRKRLWPIMQKAKQS